METDFIAAEKQMSENFLHKIKLAAFWKRFLIFSVIAMAIFSSIRMVLNGMGLRSEDDLVLAVILALATVGLEACLVTGIVSYFVVVKKINTILQILGECGISADQAAEELKSVRFIADQFGFTDRLLVLPKTVVVPFEALCSIRMLAEAFDAGLTIECKNHSFSIRLAGVSAAQHMQTIEKLIELNKSKLSEGFYTKFTKADYSE